MLEMLANPDNSPMSCVVSELMCPIVLPFEVTWGALETVNWSQLFSTIARMGLCLAFVLETVLIAQGHFQLC